MSILRVGLERMLMRTLFDQYRHPENRLTHALISCLAEDPALLASFLRWLDVSPPRGERLLLLEQRLPGDAEDRAEESELEVRRLPDAWIYTESGWALLIESKVAAPIDLDQLRGHLSMATRRGFTTIELAVLSPLDPPRALPSSCRHRRWSAVYAWACAQAQDTGWARQLTRYMPVAEQRMVDDGYLKEGTLTTFTGIPFDYDHPYTYLEAKRLLRLLMLDLREETALDAIGTDRVGSGRGAIRGTAQESVWDMLRIGTSSDDDAFTKLPHLTIAILRDRTLVQLTLPNGLDTPMRRRWLDGGYVGFQQAIGRFVERIAPLLDADPGAAPFVIAQQRHWRTRSGAATVDAMLEFDPRTAVASGSAVKLQEEWLKAAFGAMANRQSNIQLAVGVAFPYARSSSIASAGFVQVAVASWLATAPLLARLAPTADLAA